MKFNGRTGPGVIWLVGAFWLMSIQSLAATEPEADPAAWGVYARLLGTDFAGYGERASWRWGPDNTIVEKRGPLRTTVIRKGEQPGELVSVYNGGLYTFDGRIAPDGSVTWIRRGNFLKMPSRVSIAEGRYLEEALKLDKNNQFERVSSTLRLEQTQGPLVDRESVATAVASVPAPVAEAATPASAPPLPSPDTSPVVPPAAQASVITAAEPKSGPRSLSEAELATLRQRIEGDKVRRAQALTREQEAAEQQRQQFEQQQMAALEETQYWGEEVAAPAPNLAAVFLNTLSGELAKHQADREAQDAFIRDVQRQQRAVAERRQREEERQRHEAERARQQQYVQASQSAPAQARTAQDASRQAAAEARDRELVAQASAERARQQQLRTQQAAAAQAASKPAASEAAAKPLRFILTISLLNQPGDTVNPTCYSNVITRPGPPGWGGPGFLPPGSGDQAHAAVHALKDTFIARCRASGREITSEGNFNYVWNRSGGEEAMMQDVRPRFREDVSVSL